MTTYVTHTHLYRKGLTCAIVFSISLVLAPIALGVTFTTADSGGADSWVASAFPDLNRNGNGKLLEARRTSDLNSRMSYLRWDLSSLSGVATDVNMTVMVGFASNSVDYDISVWGLNDGNAGESWDETTITWNNAPGNDPTVHDLNASQVTLLGTLTGPVGTAAGDILSFSSLAMDNFVNADTDGRVTLIMTFDGAANEEQVSFMSKEDSTTFPSTGLTYAPTLDMVEGGLEIVPALQLRINRWTGQTRIVAGGDDNPQYTDPTNVILPANLVSYTIQSDPAQPPLENVWIPGNWNSITVQDGGDWEEVPPTAPLTQEQALTETNLLSSKALVLGDEVSLGNIYDLADTKMDVAFMYGLSGDTFQRIGTVVFDGDGIRIRVNKSSGKVELINGEAVSIEFDGYVIQSPSGDLNTVTWGSLESQSVPGWEETNSSSSAISELNFTNSSLLEAASVLGLGNPYQGGLGGIEDLTFEYRLVNGQVEDGVIEYVIPGDMDGDGDVDADDVPLFIQALVDRVAYDANEFTTLAGFLIDADVNGDVNGDGIFDLGDISDFNYLLSGLASATAVPEPGSAALAGAALGLLVLAGHRRRTQLMNRLSRPCRRLDSPDGRCI